MDRVVGVDDWSDWPESVRDIPRVGPDQQVSMERVKALQPDLVLASLSVPGMEWNVQRLQSSGLPYLTVVPHGLNGLWDNLRQVGEATGTRERAETVIGDLKRRIDNVRERTSRAPHRPRVYFEWWPKPLFAPGKRNWLTEVTEIAGGVSITGHVDADSASPAFEDVVAADPEYILLAWTGIAREKVKPGVVLRRPGWERIAAVRNHRIHVLEEGLYCRPSPRLIDGLEQLAAILHPDLSAS
jgi:iron complex transport system substrate-binding protein